MTLDRARLKTPPGPIGVLCEPAALRACLSDRAVDRETRQASIEIGEKTLAAWRRELQTELRLTSPVIVTGHQVEFFHAGVFAKIIAADLLASLVSGSSTFVAVDSDTPKSTRLSATQVTTGGARRVEVVIPELASDLAMESQAKLPAEKWLDFFTRVAELAPNYEASALRIFADGWLRGASRELDIVAAMSRGHEAVQAAVGVSHTQHVALSKICEQPAFLAFVMHIVRNAERFATAYNTAQRNYRDRHGVRTDQRPVPPLRMDAARIELPFWHIGPEGERGRLHVSIAHENPRFDVDGKSGVAFEELRRIRPRALTLTMFLRLFLADVFIHGIGGAKYDEVTDELTSEFFGIDPAPMACVSATLFLHDVGNRGGGGQLRATERAVRDIRYNPQRYIDEVPQTLLAQRAALIERTVSLRAHDRLNRKARRETYRELRELNEQILATRPWRASELSQHLERLVAAQRDEALRADREAFYGLHSLARLRELADAIRKAIE